MITFEIPGQPMGKQRPKFARVGNYTRTYTPKETINYETLVKMGYRQIRGKYYGEEPLSIHIQAYYKVPASYSNKKREMCLSGEIRPTTKPDADNIAKIICDSLNGVAYADDKQIVGLKVEKYYAPEPCVMVRIKEQKDETD